jgi:hypothetical protein
VLLSADVLQPTAATTTTTTISRRTGELLVQDGPFAETKEALAGVFLVDVADLDAAIRWAEKCPGAQWGVVEVRPSATAFVDGAWARTASVGQRADSVAHAAELAARDSYGKVLALLAASTRDIGAAEDALADAFERALQTWPAQGVPDRPDAWLLAVARNRLRDEWKSARARYTVPLDVERDAPTYLDDLALEEIPDRRLA